MKKIKHLIVLYSIIIGLVLVVGALLLRKPDIKLITIEVPEKTGSFSPLVLEDVEKSKDSIVYLDGPPIYIENEVNKKLAEKYAKAVYERDSLEQLNLFLSAIEIRQYNETFENDDIKLSMEIETTGYLNYVTPNYTIKSYSLTTPIEDRKRRTIYGGMTVSNTLLLDDFEIIGNLGLKTKKDNLFILGYGTQETITLTYLTTFFNF